MIDGADVIEPPRAQDLPKLRDAAAMPRLAVLSPHSRPLRTAVFAALLVHMAAAGALVLGSSAYSDRNLADIVADVQIIPVPAAPVSPPAPAPATAAAAAPRAQPADAAMPADQPDDFSQPEPDAAADTPPPAMPAPLDEPVPAAPPLNAHTQDTPPPAVPTQIATAPPPTEPTAPSEVAPVQTAVAEPPPTKPQPQPVPVEMPLPPPYRPPPAATSRGAARTAIHPLQRRTAQAASQAPAAVAAVDAGAAASAVKAAAEQDALTGRIREAVQAAAQCPAAARMLQRSGRAGITFDYRDGALVGGVSLTRSSGTGMLDSAALTAVRAARYPPAPPDQAGRILHLLVWVDEACGG